jgi:hypothetical protein
MDVSAERHFCDGCLIVRMAIGRFWRGWSLRTFLDLGLLTIGTWAGPPSGDMPSEPAFVCFVKYDRCGRYMVRLIIK